MLFGTLGRAVLYTGEGFRKVPVGQGRTIFDSDRDSSGRIFLGGRSLMGVLLPDRKGRFKERSLVGLLPDSLQEFGSIWGVVHNDEENEVWFNAKDHIFHYEGGMVQAIPAKNRFFRLYSVSGQPVVQDLEHGLYRLDMGGRQRLPGSRELVKGKRIRSIMPAPDGRTWILLTREQGLYRYDPSTGESEQLNAPEKSGASSNRKKGGASDRLEGVAYTACRMEAERNPWGAVYAIGTRQKGLYLLDRAGRIVHRMTREDGLPSDHLWDLQEVEGNLWAGTNQGIALIHTGLPFSFAEEGEQFRGAVIDLFRPTSDAPLHIGTTQGAWRLEDLTGGFIPIDGMDGLCFDFICQQSAYEEGGGSSSANGNGFTLLVAMGDGGVFRFEDPGGGTGKKFITDKRFDPFSYDLARIPELSKKAMGNGKKDGRGASSSRVLMGGRSGLFVLGRDAWKRKGALEPLLSVRDVPESIRSIGVEVGPKGDSLYFWGGMGSQGVMKVITDPSLKVERVVHYDTSYGLPSGETWVFDDPEGDGVLFGTSEGLYRFDGSRFVPCCRYGRMFCESGRQVFRFANGLKDGEVWINDAVGGGIKHVIPEGDKQRIEKKIFRAMDLGTLRAILPEKEKTWFGGSKGMAAYFPEVKYPIERDWRCSLQRVLGADDSLLFAGTFWKKERAQGLRIDGDTLTRLPVEEQPDRMLPVLPYSRNRMQFHYAAAFPDRQEKVRYRYKLVGFDTAWSDPTQETKKEYTNLPEGDYRFKVKARNVYKQESSVATYRFRILPPWYRTWWAYGGYAVLAIAMVWFLLWLNGRRLQAQKERLEKIVQERTQEIQEKNRNLEKANQTISEQKAEVEEQKAELEEAHREITQSIDYARKIQFALLQPEEHVSSHLPDHFILFKPQTKVSGDFYWAREHQGHLYIAAVDCTGHGVPGAFMSMLGISQLNEIMSTEASPSPGYVLTELRDRVVRELSSSDPESTAKDGMDAALLKIPLTDGQDPDSDSKKIEFAGANNPLYVVNERIAEGIPDSRSREVGTDQDRLKPFKGSSDGIEIKGDPMPVGYDEHSDRDFRTVSFQASKGDMLYIFSDGYADQFGGPKGKKFRYRPFKQLLTEIHEKPVSEQKKELDRVFEDWMEEGKQEQIDDVLVIGIRV